MKLIFQGKTKDVYDSGDGNVIFKFKDDATGKDGIFDPGQNQVGLTIKGLGKTSLELSKYYFEKLRAMGIPTHYVSCDLDNVTMTVHPAVMFGKGLEVICRLKAIGSFYRRYSGYCTEGQDLDYLIEFTLKDDKREDPPATKDTLIMLGIVTESEYDELEDLTKKIAVILKEDLADKGLTLYDMKFEFARVDGEIALVDEISPGNIRVYYGDKAVEPMEIIKYVLEGK